MVAYQTLLVTRHHPKFIIIRLNMYISGYWKHGDKHAVMYGNVSLWLCRKPVRPILYRTVNVTGLRSHDKKKRFRLRQFALLQTYSRLLNSGVETGVQVVQ